MADNVTTVDNSRLDALDVRMSGIESKLESAIAILSGKLDIISGVINGLNSKNDSYESKLEAMDSNIASAINILGQINGNRDIFELSNGLLTELLNNKKSILENSVTLKNILDNTAKLLKNPDSSKEENSNNNIMVDDIQE